MTFDLNIFLVGIFAALGSLASALYARHRMNVRVRAIYEHTTKEVASLRDSNDRLTRSIEKQTGRLDNELQALAHKQSGFQDESTGSYDRLAESINETAHHAFGDHLALQDSIEALTQHNFKDVLSLQESLDSLSQAIEVGVKNNMQLADRLTGFNTAIAGVETRMDAIVLDMETQLSVDRVADVEQLAITGALMAADALKQQGATAPTTVSSSMHGHGLLIYQLLLDASGGKQPKDQGGFHVLEIGSTREKWWTQMSTSRLAAVCRALGYHAITVDVDEQNTNSASTASRFYGNAIEAKTSPGEVFVEEWDGPLPPYIYIDAYDFEHEMHSDKRQSRYQTLQGASINNEACWTMHLRCALAFAEKCPIGSIVVFDDVFYQNDVWEGKGKKAIPCLLDAGFEVTARTHQTAVLRRTAQKPVDAEAY
jgi:hypothetical protein